MGPRSQRRPGISLVEILVVLAVVGILLLLLLPALARIRAISYRTQCQNNLRQLALAMHTSHDANKRMPPLFGYYPYPPNTGQKTGLGTAFFHILPFISQVGPYESSLDANGIYNTSYMYGTPHALGLRLLECPSDPTRKQDLCADKYQVGTGPGGGNADPVSCYVLNGQVFAVVDGSGVTTGDLAGFAGRPTLGTSFFADGPSKTILLAEKLARCGVDGPVPSGATFSVGTLWTYDQGVSSGGLVGTVSVPGFAISNYARETAWSLPVNIGPASKFQFEVKNPTVAITSGTAGCYPTVASTPHTDGIQVALADGHVRQISPNMSATTWWAACTPAGNDLMGPDW
jgi:prepilin-type processing-associated H-X9-DG protein